MSFAAVTRAVCIALALAGSLGATTATAAQDENETAARDAFREGIAFYEKGRFADALSAFKRAYSLRPSYKILFNIGQVQAVLENDAAALDAFEGFLAEGGEAVEAKRRLEVEKEILRLQSAVGSLTVDGPQGAVLWVDGENRGYLPLAGPMRLDAGEHLLIVRTAEEVICEKRQQIDRRENVTFSCAPPSSAPPEGPPDPPSAPLSLSAHGFKQAAAPPARNSKPAKVAAWTLAGVGAATLVAAIVCAAKAKALNSDLGEACPTGDCPPHRKSDVDALPAFAGAADGLFIGTAALETAAIAIFAATKAKERRTAERKP